MNRLNSWCFGALLSLLFLQPVLASESRGERFLWGVANAAFQVEGSPVDSDWYRFTHKKGNIKDGTNADTATDFWNRYAEDFDLAKRLGANSFRISIAWERIEPSPEQWDETALDHYERMIVAMRARGLEPVVTLQHFVFPIWIVKKGGPASPEFSADFTRYALKVIHRLSQAPANVKFWMTFNEPEVLVFNGFLLRTWPPKKFGRLNETMQAAAGLARAHLSLAKEIRLLPLSRLRLGFAKHWITVMPKTGSAADQAAARAYDDILNRQFIDAFAFGKIRFKLPGGKLIREDFAMPGGGPAIDYLGINYYRRAMVSSLPVFPGFLPGEGPGPKNDLKWEMYAPGFGSALRDVARYGFPILVSENGVADQADAFRADFLREHIRELVAAKRDGAPIIGYLHWSLTDNFEWAQGLGSRFGLVEIDYRTLERRPRPSFNVYRDLISSFRTELATE